ncbi:hypothetical protein TNIN_445581 [Trichonephila inaurata madagascariensis]|uniref:Uncharacterized protein n=1 Tax=Trichonephila inaurata madagascariensis TaxID=2747483 RepID=A0A8X6WZD4_9ARAC|nr:hypothetical protein TNIN_445581 [Trichonephila inaurata madagascariensis]
MRFCDESRPPSPTRKPSLRKTKQLNLLDFSPNLVATVGNNLVIIDVTVPFENGRCAFQRASKRKKTNTSHSFSVSNQSSTSRFKLYRSWWVP